MFSDLALVDRPPVHVDRPRRSRTGDRPQGLGGAVAGIGPRSRRSAATSPQPKITRRPACRPSSATRCGSSVSIAIPRCSGQALDARRRAVRHHRRPARGRDRVPAESASDLGPATRRGAVSGSVAVQWRRLLLSSDRAAAAGRVADAGARSHERRRRQLPRGASRQRRRAVADRGRAAPGGCRRRSSGRAI